MPCFINNKGEPGYSEVPSLFILAILSDGLTEKHVERMPPGLKPLVMTTRRQLGYVFPRSLHRTPVYLEKDLTTTFLPYTTISICKTARVADEYVECVMPRRDSNEDITRGDVRNWPQVSSKVQSCIRDIVVVFFRNTPARGEFMACGLVRMKSNEGNSKRLGLEVTPELLRFLDDDGVVLCHIERLVIVELLNGALPRECLAAMPHLRHLDIHESLTNATPLLAVKHSLENLRIRCCTEFGTAGGVESVLSQMTSLRVLIVQWDIEYRINWTHLELCASLRSLTLIEVNPGRASNVVAFLTREVTFRRRAVARQHILDDFTIICPKASVMEEVYQSEALTPRTKARIFSTLTVGHMSSALQVISRRSDYGYCASLNGVLHYARPFFSCRVEHQAVSTLILVLLEIARHSFRYERMFLEVVQMLLRHVQTHDMVQLTDPGTVRSIEDTVIRIGLVIEAQRRNLSCAILRSYKSLHIPAEDEMEPRSNFASLNGVVRLSLMGAAPTAFLESLLWKRIKIISDDALPIFFKKIKKSLCRAIMMKVPTGSASVPLMWGHIASPITDDMMKLLIFIHEKATDEVADLRVAAKAVLRKSAAAPLYNAQLSDDDIQKEEELMSRTIHRRLSLQNDDNLDLIQGLYELRDRIV